ncbi:BLUF domain-containing protein [Hymenobacter sp. UV11]|uniref:BLUF domain-containing protein n=1 Tax=Hymenobacter sp. UV11 TaxID=1849735 RepID=UPI0010EA917D|nr:BLUF domain-containing protein [Hymenobacter sp. UV11]TDN39363.1 hypothetical protein A8B98_19140 [Hymenobacter sp. UV11]
MPLHHLIYESQATQPLTEADLLLLLQQARAYNQANELTGLLLYASDGHFLQVLEGPMEVLHQLYFERIAHDPRHHRLQLLAAGVLERRRFSDWHMGFRFATPEALGELTGHFNTADATFLLPLLHNLPSPLLDKLLDYVQYTAPSADLEETRQLPSARE